MELNPVPATKKITTQLAVGFSCKPTANINTVSTLSISNTQPIFDLTGIKDFTLLQELYITSQYLAELDISGMFYLQTVMVTGNYLTCLDFSGCPSLYLLYCDNNFLTQIDISQNSSMQVLKADRNRNLECIQVDLDNIPNTFIYDFNTTTYSDNCGYTGPSGCLGTSILEPPTKDKELLYITHILGRTT